MTQFEFVKSSYSASSGECVEVATNVAGTVAVRDSKRADGAVVEVGDLAWAVFARTL
ncbi:DUF397 domain-containing protein [Streptomyces sp. A1547]|uniref:DUF397 domain-containing protein n=1 Tax=Streptomyces sp. A1547 TaxID=2563105 RepID=UPI00109E560A|nr:DUF397 domain-containing protein [Streptomyces sp. A1547]THA34978.1 DUF397 domain-containing protein [Streptomyces sp. A1547]